MHIVGRQRMATRSQGSAAAMVILLLVLLGAALAVLWIGMEPDSIDPVLEERRTRAALTTAREALIAYSLKDANRMGSLVCPDTDNDGVAQLFSGNQCPAYLGRLPWKTLRIPALRDGSGERLWYALSRNFRDHPSAGTPTSERSGELTVTGTGSARGVVAVLFAPGRALAAQSRDGTGANQVASYLEGGNADGNNSFEARSRGDDFNDRLLAITAESHFPPLEHRVAADALRCLQLFSKQTGVDGRYPWAAPLTDLSFFGDEKGRVVGRLPRSLHRTAETLALERLGWPPGCFSEPWWDAWRELIFYHVAPAYRPEPSAPRNCRAGGCLKVNATNAVKVVVIVAGRAFDRTGSPDQTQRPSARTAVTDYLETDPATGINNADGAASQAYAQGRAALAGSMRFNDETVCLSEGGPSGSCD
jgi:hypothetical protein